MGGGDPLKESSSLHDCSLRLTDRMMQWSKIVRFSDLKEDVVVFSQVLYF